MAENPANSTKKFFSQARASINSLSFYEKIQISLSFIGILSLAFIILQTRAMNEQSRLATENMQASMYATIAAHTMEMDRIFVDRPELRPYFYSNKPIDEADKVYDQVMAVAEHELDLFDSIYTQLGYIPDDEDKDEDRETWRRYFAASFAKSPALCKRYYANKDWYMRSLGKLADENCK